MKTLIIGIGNILLADEGIGVHVANAFTCRGVDDDVTVIDAGTAILDTLPYLEKAENIIIIDAMKAGGKSGSIYKIPFEECNHPEFIASMHGFDLSRVLSLTEIKDFPQITIIGVEPAKIEWSMDLTPDLSEALPRVIQIVDEIIIANRTCYQQNRSFSVDNITGV